MKNNFKENLNKKIVRDISDNTISDLQLELSNEARYGMENIYDAFNTLAQNNLNSLKLKPSRSKTNINRSFDYGLTLSLFMQKFIQEHKNEIENMRTQFIEKQRVELGICDTKNPNYFKGKDNCYYSFDYDKFIKQEKIIDVDENGYYITCEQITETDYNVIKVHTAEDSITYLYVTDKQGKKVNNLAEAVRILGFRKEVVKKVKRIGYCGNSVDFWADILNMFYTPTQTGYYSDNFYNFYKWDYKNNQFIRQIREGTTPGAPDIADYEHKNTKIVVRTDYTGEGLSLQMA